MPTVQPKSSPPPLHTHYHQAPSSPSLYLKHYIQKLPLIQYGLKMVTRIILAATIHSIEYGPLLVAKGIENELKHCLTMLKKNINTCANVLKVIV